MITTKKPRKTPTSTPLRKGVRLSNKRDMQSPPAPEPALKLVLRLSMCKPAAAAYVSLFNFPELKSILMQESNCRRANAAPYSVPNRGKRSKKREGELEHAEGQT
jgi:hypothetical protein